MRKSAEDIGYVFAVDNNVNDFDGIALNSDADISAEEGLAKAELSAIMAVSGRDTFVKKYPFNVAKAMILPASQCTLGDLLIKLKNLGHNTRNSKGKPNKFAKMDNPLKDMSKENYKQKLEDINVTKEILWGRFGNIDSISALYKLNMLNWHWANGNSEYWKFDLKLKEHVDAVTLIYDLKRYGNKKALYTFYKSFAKHLLLDAGYSAPTDRQVLGIAAAFHAETRGDLALFNSMSNQNLEFVAQTTEYAYGIQQRLNSRIIGYHIWACQSMIRKGFDIFSVPAAILSSPILSREYEAYYLNKDQYAKNMLANYMRQTESTSIGFISLSDGRKFFDSAYGSADYATGAALHFLQGISPTLSPKDGYGTNWKAKDKTTMFNNLNK